MLFETVRLALRSVKRNALRSFLTLLGIVIGVAAVIAMITIGSGTTEKVKSDISKLGSNLLVVRSGAQSSRGASREAARPLGDKELAALSTQLSGAKAVSAASAGLNRGSTNPSSRPPPAAAPTCSIARRDRPVPDAAAAVFSCARR